MGQLDGRLLELLVRAMGAQRAVEIGTLGGYSGVCLRARHGEDRPCSHTFELSEAHAEVARELFQRAGVASQVRIHVGPAIEGLPAISGRRARSTSASSTPTSWATPPTSAGPPTTSGSAAWCWATTPSRVGHLAEENPSGDDAPGVRALQGFSQSLAKSGRFRATIIPTAEGLAFGVKVR